MAGMNKNELRSTGLYAPAGAIVTYSVPEDVLGTIEVIY